MCCLSQTPVDLNTGIESSALSGNMVHACHLVVRVGTSEHFKATPKKARNSVKNKFTNYL